MPNSYRIYGVHNEKGLKVLGNVLARLDYHQHTSIKLPTGAVMFILRRKFGAGAGPGRGVMRIVVPKHYPGFCLPVQQLVDKHRKEFR